MMKQPVRTNMSDFIKTTMGSQFVIPVYQRNYTWSPEGQTARFMNDVEDLLEKRADSHFLGILIYLESEISAMYKEIQIVDGQQRLTTSFIFLLCLKRAAQELNEKDTFGMIDDYYLYNRHAAKDARLRLKPAVSDDDVYAKLVYGSYKDLSRSERETGVYRNYDYIYRRIMEFRKKHTLLEILNCLSRIDILVFPLSESDNAQQIFESINSTGAPLTSADLIRNYILMNDTNDVQERNYRLYWQPLEALLPESRKLEEFFRYFLAAKTYNLLNKRDVYEGFKVYWNTSKDDRETRMSDIGRYCRYYTMIYDGPCEEPEIEKVMRDFRRNESRTPAPFLMEMYHLYADGLIDAATLCRQIRLVDSYLTRRALAGSDTGGLSRYFPQLLRSVMNSWKKKRRNIYEITKVYLINYNKGKSLAMPTDKEIRTRLREVNAYSMMCIRPVLERIEHYGATAQVDTSDLNIEHIMPQHPNNWWKKNSGAKDTEEYTMYVNLIGNLTLCAEYDNTRMGNQDFNFKKSVLKKTMHIRMNTALLEMDHWTVQDILNRCDEMAKQIIAIYPYQGGSDTQEDAGDDIILLNAPSVNARAIYINRQCIEIQAGTTMKPYGPQEMKSMRSLYRDMSEKGIISEDENGKIQFEQNYRFSDLNTAAQFLLHRGGDNTQAWTRENGTVFAAAEEPKAEEPVMQNTEPKKKKQNRQRHSAARTEQKPQDSGVRKEQPKKPAKTAKKKPVQPVPEKKNSAGEKTEPARKKQVRNRTRKSASGQGAEVRYFKKSEPVQEKPAALPAVRQELKPVPAEPEEKKPQGFFRNLFSKKN
ncbi:MAG: DUF262 domain-containing protein [Solobacterium sp.]|nr:DUF262 domain-containing protein [Solobacterium sp.]